MRKHQPNLEKAKAIRERRDARLKELNFTKKKRKGCKGYADREEQIMYNVCIDPDSGCWIWTLNLNNVGYGQINWVEDGVKHCNSAHRASYETFNGDIPEGKDIGHYCDVTYCVCPSHLFPVTAKENSDDMIRKGRDNFFNYRKVTNYKAGTKRYTDGNKIRFFVPGKEPKGWTPTRNRRGPVRYPKLAEGARRREAAKREARAIISRLQANNIPQMV